MTNRVRTTPIAMAALMAVVLVTASAASLGGIDVADLFSWSGPVSVSVPSPIGADDFACNGDLHGQSDDLGHVWSDHGGSWQCVGGGLVRARDRVPLGHATVDFGVSDHVYVTAAINSISTQNDRSGLGVSVLSDGGSHLYVIYERDQGRVTLGKREVALVTVLGTAPVSDRDAAVLRVEIDQPQIRVLIDGVSVITYTMSPVETTLFGGNTRFGLDADNDNQSRFDWFRAES